jgi:hypothetical protein
MDSFGASGPGETSARPPAKLIKAEALSDHAEEKEAIERRRRILITPDKVRMLLDSADGARIGHKNNQ